MITRIFTYAATYVPQGKFLVMTSLIVILCTPTFLFGIKKLELCKCFRFNNVSELYRVFVAGK